jgi:hypothetical protein
MLNKIGSGADKIISLFSYYSTTIQRNLARKSKKMKDIHDPKI